MYERNLWQLGGPNSLTQWYCPPDVGALRTVSSISCYSRYSYIDAISAKEATTKPKPIMQIR